MGDTSAIEENRRQPKWQVIISLIFGFVTLIPFIVFLFIRYPDELDDIVAIIWFMFYLGGWIFGATAFVLGIMGLKYPRKALAITAIVESVLGFIFNMYIYNMTTQYMPYL